MQHKLKRPIIFTTFIITSMAISTGYATDSQKAGQNSAPKTSSYKQVTTLANWSMTLGAGAAFAPPYEGSDKMKWSLVPVVEILYKDGLFFAGMEGIGITALQSERSRFSMALGYDRGRDEDDDSRNLRGMGDISSTVLGILSGEYTVGPVILGATATKGLGGDYGATTDLSISSGFPVSEKLMLSGDIHSCWASDKHMEQFFGISALQAARSGEKTFSATSGFKSYGIALEISYRITTKWSIFIDAAVNQLTSDAAASPLSIDNTQFSSLMGLSCSF